MSSGCQRGLAAWIGPVEVAFGELAGEDRLEVVVGELEHRVEQHGAAREAGVVGERLRGQGAAQRVADHEVPARLQVVDEVAEPVALAARAGTVASEVGSGDVGPGLGQR